MTKTFEDWWESEGRALIEHSSIKEIAISAYYAGAKDAVEDMERRLVKREEGE